MLFDASLFDDYHCELNNVKKCPVRPELSYRRKSVLIEMKPLAGERIPFECDGQTLQVSMLIHKDEIDGFVERLLEMKEGFNDV